MNEDDEPQEIHLTPQRAWFSGATVWTLIALSVLSTCAVLRMSFKVDRMWTREQMREYSYRDAQLNTGKKTVDVDDIAKTIP